MANAPASTLFTGTVNDFFRTALGSLTTTIDRYGSRFDNSIQSIFGKQLGYTLSDTIKTILPVATSIVLQNEIGSYPIKAMCTTFLVMRLVAKVGCHQDLLGKQIDQILCNLSLVHLIASHMPTVFSISTLPFNSILQEIGYMLGCDLGHEGLLSKSIHLLGANALIGTIVRVGFNRGTHDKNSRQRIEQ